MDVEGKQPAGSHADKGCAGAHEMEKADRRGVRNPEISGLLENQYFSGFPNIGEY